MDVLAESIGKDSGAQLTLRAIRELMADDSSRDTASASGSDATVGILPVIGPLLRLAAPRLTGRLRTTLARAKPGLIEDPALTRALEQASGLFLDCGQAERHHRALARVDEIVDTRGYRRVTVAAFDWLPLRLMDVQLPAELRVLPAREVFDVSAAPWLRLGLWDGLRTDLANPYPPDTAGLGCVPDQHRAASAPVLFTYEAMSALRAVVEAKRAWLRGRPLDTFDARSLARYADARHTAELFLPVSQPPGGGER